MKVESEELRYDQLMEKVAKKLAFTHKKSEREQVVIKAIEEVYPGLSMEEKVDRMQRFLSYDIIDEYMADQATEDIMVNGVGPIFVFNSKDGMIKTGRRFRSEEELERFISKLLLFSDRPTQEREAIMNLHLPEGGRVNVVNSPFGHQITIRKFRQKPLSIINLIDLGTLDFELAAQFWLYSEGLSIKPANILIGGMPGSGKTTLLNALFSFFRPNERVILIEDTMELNTSQNENCARLEATGDLTLGELVKNSLRMRPDRIVIGEVRGNEANDLMTAMNIGKIGMGTIHASNARELVMRLENTPMNVPSEVIPLIDVFIIVKRYYINNRMFRVVSQVSETGGVEKKVLLSDLCVYELKTGKMSEIHPSVIYRDRLSQAAGVTPREIMDEIMLRTEVLKSLAKKNIKSIEDISAFCAHYYDNPNEALEEIKFKD